MGRRGVVLVGCCREGVMKQEVVEGGVRAAREGSVAERNGERERAKGERDREGAPSFVRLFFPPKDVQVEAAPKKSMLPHWFALDTQWVGGLALELHRAFPSFCLPVLAVHCQTLCSATVAIARRSRSFSARLPSPPTHANPPPPLQHRHER